MADNNDTTLSLGFNLKQAEADIKKIPQMLNEALKKIEGKGLTDLENQIKANLNVADTLAGKFSNVDDVLKQLDRDTRELQALKDLKLPFAEEIKAEERGVKNLQDAWYKTWQLKPDSEGAKTNRAEYEKLTGILDANRALLTELDTEEGNLTSRIQESTSALETMRNDANALKATTDGLVTKTTEELSALEKSGQIERDLTTDTKEQSDATGNIKENLEGANNAAAELSQSIKEPSIGKTEDLSPAGGEIDDIKGKAETAKQIISEFGMAMKMAGSIGSKGLSVVTGVIGVIKRGFSSLSKSVNNAGKTIKSALSGVSKIIHKVRSAFSGMSGDMNHDFKHMITNITKYVLGFRSLFFLVRRLRKYIGEGIQNMAQFNDGNNHVNESITRLLSSLLYLKNAWATAFSPILQVVTPILEHLIDTIAAVGNAFSRFLGSILGVKTVFQAVKVDAADYAKSLAKAGGSAGKAADKTKKLTDRLAAFDDLNVLGKDKDPNDTGSGGGGGAGNMDTPDPNEMFKLVDVGKEALTKLKEMWATADFTSLGKTVGHKIVDALNGIDWPKIQDTAIKIGSSIITFLNGALGNDTLWVSVGETIGEGLNTVGLFLSSVLQNNTVDWGGGLATLVNTLFTTVDWAIVQSNIITFGKLLKTNIISFLQTLNWEDIKTGFSSIATALGTAIADIVNDPTLAQELGVTAGEIINLLIGILSDTFINNPVDLGGSIATFLSNLFATIDWDTFNSDLEGFGKTLVDNLNSFFANLNLFGDGGILGDLSGAAKGFTTAIVTIIEGLDFNAIITSAAGIADALLTGIQEGLEGSDNPILQSLGSIIGSLSSAFETLLPVLAPVIEMLSTLVSSVLTVIGPIIEPICNIITEVAQTVLPVISSALETLAPYLAEFASVYLTELLTIFTALEPFFTAFAESVLPILDELLGSIFGVITGIADVIISLWSNTGDLSGTLAELLAVCLKPILAIARPLLEILSVVLSVVADLLGPIVQLIDPLLTLLVSCLDPLTLVFEFWGKLMETFLIPIIKLVAAAIEMLLIPILDALVVGVGAITSVLGTAGTALSVFGTLALGVFDEIYAGAVDNFNGIIGCMEAFVNCIISGFNGMIGTLNKLSFEVPDWVPDYGGKEFGFSIPKLSTISLPRLAQGAVIPPNKEFMAVLGDQSHGTNIEAPLDTIKQAVAEVMGTNAGNQEVIQLLQQLITVVENKNLTIGDKEIGKANARYTNQQRMIRGTSF